MQRVKLPGMQRVKLILAHIGVYFTNNFFSTLCMLGSFAVFGVFFFKIYFKTKNLSGTLSESNILDLEQDRHFVDPDLGPYCLRRLSADDKPLLARKE